MIEKVITNENQSAAKKERFEFKLTVNGNIICQRYFRINGFKREAYGSLDIIDAVDTCVSMIDRDLRDKSHLFLEYTAPQVFKGKAEMEEWLKVHGGSLKDALYIVFEDTPDVMVYNQGELKPFTKMFNRNDYVADKEYDNKVEFKFSFLDNGREVASKVWDGTVYPRFIRTNVDLSNSRNKYRHDNIFAPIESYMMDQFIKEKTDLIPSIVKELCSACCYDEAEDYTDTVKYGKTTYDLDIHRVNRKRIRTLEALYRRKTSEYFRNI